MSLLSRLNQALRAMTVEPQDVAVVELVKKYAASIDECLKLEKLTPSQVVTLKDMGLGKAAAAVDEDVLKNLGPKLLDALTEMGMTPKSRDAVMRGPQTNDGDSDKITDLRSRRQQRAANLD